MFAIAEHPGVGSSDPLLGNSFEDKVLPVEVVDFVRVVHAHDVIIEVQKNLRQVRTNALRFKS